MEALDQLISNEERRIDHLMEMRNRSGASSGCKGQDQGLSANKDLEYDIEKAYEQLSIYKIRKYMGF